MAFIEYLPEILVCIAIICAGVFYIIKYIKATPEDKRKIIAEIIYSLAIKAEKEYGSKTGQAKKKQVIAWFYEKYPALCYIMSEEELGTLIDEKAAELTEWLKSNPDAAINILGENIK